MSLFINSKGIVDNVIFSEHAPLYLGLLIDFNDLKKRLVGIKLLHHRNEILTQLVSLNRGDEDIIKNGDELQECWEGIEKTSKEINNDKRKQIFLPPIVITQKAKKIIN